MSDVVATFVAVRKGWVFEMRQMSLLSVTVHFGGLSLFGKSDIEFIIRNLLQICSTVL